MQPQSTPAPIRGQQESSVNSQENTNGLLFTILGVSTKATKDKPSRKMYEFATQLRTAVLTTGYHFPFSVHHWAKEFAALSVREGEEKTATVLCWFCENVRGPFTPRVRSAACFRKRFGDLQEAMARNQAKRPSSQVVVSPEVQFVIKRLMFLEWPNGSQEQLPAVVEQSFQNLKSWLTRMKRAKLPDRLDMPRRQLMSMIGDYEHYLEQWFTRFWEKYHAWKDWSGDMGATVWTPFHPQFVSLASQYLDPKIIEATDGSPR